MSTLAESFGLAAHLVAEADPVLLQIVGLSLRVSGTATLIGASAGLLLGAWLAVTRVPGSVLLIWAVNTLLALPPVVVGLLVYLLLSRAGPLGPLGILFTPAAMVVAQSVLVVPLVAALTRRIVLDALNEGGEQLQSLGAGPLQRALLMLLHERLALLTVLLTAFGRAISEVGAVMIVGGNIEGVTRVMTTAIALETSKGDLPLALALGAVLLGVVGLVNGLSGVVMAWQRRLGTSTSSAKGEDTVVAQAAPAATTVGMPVSPSPVQGSGSRAKGRRGLPLLRLASASLTLGSVRALSHLDMTLYRGECVALLGANGAGKTSLLRLLHGLVSPTQGQRQTLALQPEQRLPVLAMLFQRPFLLRLSVRRNVLLALALRGVPRAERELRCRQALQQVGLAALAGRDARSLSGGQQQRLALARAWALRPDVLLLDEPTASLDPSARREVEWLLAQVAASGVGLVISTHNLGQVKRLADRVLYLETGRIAVDLPTESFFSSALPEEAAAFLRGERPWG
jgi:tungstate transport system ATP-binding protein